MIRTMLITALVAATATPGGAAPKAKPHRQPQAVPATEYLFVERAIYELVASPGRVTDVTLEAGEALVDANPIAAGDTALWMIGDTTSGEGASRRVHVLVKPVQADLSTNLIINTTRRTYHLQMRASDRAFLVQVAWRYPTPSATGPTLIGAPATVAPAPTVPAAVESDAAKLNFAYRVTGTARWRPARVYDDGVRTVVEFGPGVVLSDLPPLFLLGPDG
jgi:type IV secretion system protein VirB9